MSENIKVSYIDQQSDSQKLLQDCIYDLRYISKCLVVVGNTELSERLSAIADDIEFGKVESDKAFMACFNQYTSSVQQGTANMMSLALGLAKKIA